MYKIIADNEEITNTNVQNWVIEYKNGILPKRQKLSDYYDGRNEIIKQNAVEGRPNYSINVNMAKYITDVATGYTFGKPVSYSVNNNGSKRFLDILLKANAENFSDELDYQIGGDMSVFGVAYQLVYLDSSDSKAKVKFKRLDPLRTLWYTIIP